MKKYAFSFLVIRQRLNAKGELDIGVEHGVGLVEAVNPHQAASKAEAIAGKLYPKEDGWGAPHAMVHDCSLPATEPQDAAIGEREKAL